MSSHALDDVIRGLERTLVNEGGAGWRNAIFGGEAADVAWPDDLPRLANELAPWFAWRPADDVCPTLAWWRSAAWAAQRHRSLLGEPGFRSSLVPVLEEHFVDADDGSIWAIEGDDDGFDRFVRTSFADFPALLASMERTHAARRNSRWRRFRVDGHGGRLTALDEVPAAEELAAMAVGTIVLAAPGTGRAPRGRMALRISQTEWLRTWFRARAPLDTECLQDAIATLRHALVHADAAIEASATESLTAELAPLIERWRARGPVELHTGLVRAWWQPPLDELLARFDRVLRRVAPALRDALAGPASETGLAELEARIGTPLPPDVRAIWSFADGQPDHHALYWGHRLASVADARRTLDIMRELAATQFGDAYWDGRLLPLLDRGNGDHLCVDVGGAYGPAGCIVEVDHDRPGQRKIVFGSATDWLECFVDGLEDGVYVADADGEIVAHEFLAHGSFDAIDRHNEVRTNGAYPWTRPIRLRPEPTSRP